MQNKLAIISDERFLNHIPASYHPENPERLKAIINKLNKTELWDKFVFIEPRQATIEEISLVHTEDHFYTVQKACQSGMNLDLDTYTSSGSWEAALLAVGSHLNAVDEIINRKVETVYALTRPPGHHARTNQAMGFCLFNNIALAARYSIKKGLKRIVIIDWDAHHGNGTQEIFYSNKEILYISFHQFPHFPGSGTIEESGRGNGLGYNINFPFPPNTNGIAYRKAIKKVVEPVLIQFKPELIMVSAGYDGHFQDPLSSLMLREEDFSWFGSWLKNYQEKSESIGILMTLEGGYQLQALANSLYQTINSLIDQDGYYDLGNKQKIQENSLEIIAKVIKQFCRYWSL